MNQNENVLEQKMLPHDTDTEQAVLSSLMRYNENITKYGDLLDVDLFYYEKEKAIFKCIEGVVNDGGITDVNSLFNYYLSHKMNYQLFRNDFVELVTTMNRETLEQDIIRLRDMSRRRKFWRMLMESAQSVLDMTNDLDEVVNDAVSGMTDMQGKTSADNIKSNDESLDAVRKIIDDNRAERGNSISTGFKLFDEKYLLSPEKLIVLAAFTSVGKSALALNIVQSVAAQGVACAYYSLEMSCNELSSRIISSVANMPASVILNKRLNDQQVQIVDNAIRKVKGLPIYYDDRSTVDFNRTIRSIRKMAKTKGIRLAVIDYLQIYAQVSDDAEQSISYMARTSKNVAKELGIAIILISQLNRSALHPSIKMLRGSGQIEESADNVVLIDRPEAYPDNKVTKYEGEFKNVSIKNTAKLILAKGRGVGTGSALVGFNGVKTQFYEIEQTEAGNYQEQTEALPF